MERVKWLMNVFSGSKCPYVVPKNFPRVFDGNDEAPGKLRQITN